MGVENGPDSPKEDPMKRPIPESWSKKIAETKAVEEFGKTPEDISAYVYTEGENKGRLRVDSEKAEEVTKKTAKFVNEELEQLGSGSPESNTRNWVTNQMAAAEIVKSENDDVVSAAAAGRKYLGRDERMYAKNIPATETLQNKTEATRKALEENDQIDNPERKAA